MKKDLFDFSDFDDNIVENIAEKCPDMDKSEQKALCGKIRQRLNTVEDFVPADVVCGVEPVKKPVFRYIFGTAAAAVFALAVIPVAFKALKNAPDAPENIQESQIIADYNASPTENEGNSTEAVTTKIEKTDVTTEITTSVTTVSKPASPTTVPHGTKVTEENEETIETVPPPPVTEGKRTTTKTLCTTVPQALPAPTTTPKATIPTKTTTRATTTKPVTTAPVITENSIFDMLAKLDYDSCTCDGIANYILTAEDGTKYLILTDCNHVWRSGGRSGYKEADITPEILEWVKKYGEPYKVKEYNATAEVDWSMNESTSDVWNIIIKGYSAVITNTDELREYLAKIYPETKVNAYLEQYNDSYFQNNVLALNAVTQGGGIGNRLEISSLLVNNSEIKVTGEWHWNEEEASILSICLIKVEIPKHMYVQQEINWDIPKKNNNTTNSATAEIDWRYYDFGGFNDYDDGLVDGIWNESSFGNMTITNSADFCKSLSTVYSENQIKEYNNKYNNDFFNDNVLLIYYKYIPNGKDDKIYMDNIEVSDNEININATYKRTGRALLAPYVCVIHVTIPKDVYNEQVINWNITEQFKIQ